jgi:hypothetical protein
MRKGWVFQALLAVLIIGAAGTAAVLASPPVARQMTLRAAATDLTAGLDSPRVVYLTPAGAALPHLRAVAEREGGVVLHDAALLPALDERVRLDALIFDAAVWEALDRDWLRRRYVGGMIVAAVNLPMAELVALVGDTTVETSSWQNNHQPAEGPYFSLRYFSIAGPDQADIDGYLCRAHMHPEPARCDPVDNVVESQLSVSGGGAQTTLADEQAADRLWTQIHRLVAN